MLQMVSSLSIVAVAAPSWCRIPQREKSVTNLAGSPGLAGFTRYAKTITVPRWTYEELHDRQTNTTIPFNMPWIISCHCAFLSVGWVGPLFIRPTASGYGRLLMSQLLTGMIAIHSFMWRCARKYEPGLYQKMFPPTWSAAPSSDSMCRHL